MHKIEYFDEFLTFSIWIKGKLVCLISIIYCDYGGEFENEDFELISKESDIGHYCFTHIIP